MVQIPTGKISIHIKTSTLKILKNLGMLVIPAPKEQRQEYPNWRPIKEIKEEEKKKDTDNRSANVFEV